MDLGAWSCAASMPHRCTLFSGKPLIAINWAIFSVFVFFLFNFFFFFFFDGFKDESREKVD